MECVSIMPEALFGLDVTSRADFTINDIKVIISLLPLTLSIFVSSPNIRFNAGTKMGTTQLFCEQFRKRRTQTFTIRFIFE